MVRRNPPWWKLVRCFKLVEVCEKMSVVRKWSIHLGGGTTHVRKTYVRKIGNLWVFPKIVVPQNGWFIMEISIKMDGLGVPPFSETPLWQGSGQIPEQPLETTSYSNKLAWKPSTYPYHPFFMGLAKMVHKSIITRSPHRDFLREVSNSWLLLGSFRLFFLHNPTLQTRVAIWLPVSAPRKTRRCLCLDCRSYPLQLPPIHHQVVPLSSGGFLIPVISEILDGRYLEDHSTYSRWLATTGGYFRHL